MAYEGEGRELNNIDFTPDFFRDEVREGFYVSTMMKRYWASQLKVLSIIARICDKYGLKWFADYGTLLGTVRHGGYVPWDDDLDICMLREDYEKLFGVLEKELPKDFKVLSLEKEPEYVEMIGRVVNSSVIDYGKEHLNEFYGCPYTVGIDIFPLDGVYNDPQKEEERRKRANAVTDVVKKFESGPEGNNSIKKNRLLRKLEKMYRECPVEGAEKVALMNFYLSRGDHLYPKELFDQVVKLPFEETFMNVPARYEEVLSIEYGDYMRVFKGGGMHDYPVYHDQEEILRQNLGENPFKYTFDMNQLLVSVSRYAKRMLEKAGNAAGGNVAGDLSGAGNRKVAVFLPCKATWWSTMEPLWQKFCADPSMEVHVLPIFYYDCDHN
ncbi:MAG: LicD family protein, partial [Butyrivibrio sp.]|nr:LicD family protein [Butyrivibrio sp.]